MSKDDDKLRIDWDAMKLKPITAEQKKSQKLSAIGKRKAKIMKEIHEDMNKSFLKPDLFNNKGRKRGK